jgi:excisionase family DNA binding protein
MHDTDLATSNQAATGLSVSDAAELLGVSVTTVRAHLRQGTLAGEKIGGNWVVYLAGLPRQTESPAPAHPESLPASDRPAPSSSRQATILAWLLVRYRGLRQRLQGLRARIPRS